MKKRRYIFLIPLSACLMLASLAGSLLSQSPAELEKSANMYYERRDYAKALKSWMKILEHNPNDERAKKKVEEIYNEKYKQEVNYHTEKINQQIYHNLEGKGKKIKIDWRSVDGAVRYDVTILDSKGNSALEKSVDTSSIEFLLPPGEYRMKVSAINRFEKIGSESDWRDFRIELKGAQDWPHDYNYHFRMAAGGQIMSPLSDWNTLYSSSANGFVVNAGAFGAEKFWKHIGIELAGSYQKLQGKEAPGVQNHELQLKLAGGNLCFATRFDFPINLFLRGGAGIVFSALTYTSKLSGNDFSESARSLYYSAGASMEYNFYGSFYLETGIDYTVIKFSTQDMKSVKYYCQAGMRL